MNGVCRNFAFVSLIVVCFPVHAVHAHEGHRVNNSDRAPAVFSRATYREASVQIHAEAANFIGHSRAKKNGSVLVVESNGLPQHGMMFGIRSWQQQVPLPQPYTGRNAWQIPLHPQLAKHPISTRNHLMRGAIALAVNGVPIFNALNNRGEDAFLAGELDQWGGHCGRGDDYHYHRAPVHLEKIVGEGMPIAFALDGFPIYGYTEPDGSLPVKLDAFNGHFSQGGHYHYHASKKYPYINGGMRGKVQMQDDQIIPQPRDAPVRPPMRPLRDAVITDYKVDATGAVLTYKQHGRVGRVLYTKDRDGSFSFEYQSPGGLVKKETYQRQQNQQRLRQKDRPRSGSGQSRRSPPRPPR